MSDIDVTIIDYGMGNLGSISNMLRKVGVRHHISSDPEDIACARRLILPGVGAFTHGMESLRARNLVPAMTEAVMQRTVPILGICLGMHLLTKSSQEGEEIGLGWINAECVRFRSAYSKNGRQLKVPHMGWNHVTPKRHSKLYAEWSGESRFYFVHSYYPVCTESEHIASITSYGETFASSIEKDHIFGVQFHPEKSHKFGMQLLTRFAEI